MKISKLTFKSLYIVVLLFAFQSLAQADPQVYVASTGTDTGTCDRSAPCRQITYALTQVTPNNWQGGTVLALDSGGYEPFSVKKSVSVVAAPGVYAEIVVSNTNGISIDALFTDTVVLRGLSLKGDKNLAIGIKVNFARMVYIEDCIISGFHQGIRSLVINGKLLIRNTTVRDCIRSGIFINSEDSGSLTVASIDHCQVLVNFDDPSPDTSSGIGIHANKNVKLTVRNTLVSNSGHGLLAGFSRFSPVTLVIENCAVTHNGGHGIFAHEGGKVYVSNSTVAFNPNGYGFATLGNGVIYTRRNNTVEENGLGPGSAVAFLAK